ncbi:3-deoxy-D-manno-octulosonic-acid transferase [Formivibrio citricus]|uniref:3-deoxy-D-manno-octulosonic acid transferase n=1 Tax=Formivibrio citricus TaxID=83765 RepID=A0A1I4YNV8_9NEIS|nr:lipid IV(A) 3-deoxy-D-manno-octulosonic acid transferase [Formivibrio citricus]SFN39667.1 3-deoxy-D-manno-octulosonic-acid transferase [Formivibrio citricus]
MIARGLYRLLLWAGLPFIFLYLLKRSRKQPAYRSHWGERLGFYPSRPAGAAPLWLHAVSVGEMRATAPLVNALLKRDPLCPILLTCMTPTGRTTAQELFGDKVEIAYLPYDYPGAVQRFLRHFRPRAGILMETELWPNLIHACADAGIPLTLANARLSQKSLAGYLKIAALIRPAVARLAGVLAQSRDDADRLHQLGARRVEIVGNIKFDNLPPAELVERGQRWKAQFAGRKTLLFASSREGEETLLLDALLAAGWPENMLLLLVPRHPQRFDAVARLLEEKKLGYLRRSQWLGDSVPTDIRVLLGDSMGEMSAWFAASDLTIMGGSLLPFGCQNLIEACAVGAPVLLGPSVFNFAEAARLALESGAAQQEAAADAIAATALSLLQKPEELQRMGTAGIDFAAAHRGVVQRLLVVCPVNGGTQ